MDFTAGQLARIENANGSDGQTVAVWAIPAGSVLLVVRSAEGVERYYSILEPEPTGTFEWDMGT